jgi:diaminopimelate epimerase
LAKRQAWVNEQKNSPCVDCKVQYPYYVMQFDHIGTDKVANIGRLLHNVGLSRLKMEVAKCEVVCANCHATRTWERQAGLRA